MQIQACKTNLATKNFDVKFCGKREVLCNLKSALDNVNTINRSCCSAEVSEFIDSAVFDHSFLSFIKDKTQIEKLLNGFSPNARLSDKGKASNFNSFKTLFLDTIKNSKELNCQKNEKHFGSFLRAVELKFIGKNTPIS